MGLFNKLFSRNANPDADRAKAIIKRALENSRKPQGADKTAVAGAEIRQRFFTLVKEVEANLGGPALGIASAEGVLMVHPKLQEELRKQPDAEVLEVALTHCFTTTDARQRLNEGWPLQVARYRGKANSETVLREKSSLLAAYVVSNLDAAEMAEGETSDEQDCFVRVEEAAVWYRVLYELAFRFLRGQHKIFVEHLQDDLAMNLALLGSPPDLIIETMAARTQEYAKYREWVPAENAGAEGTLVWEAAKHVGEPIGLKTHPGFLVQFVIRFLEKLDHALIHELLVGKDNS
jgi:hypothetical protein